jgi:hypothetical protein
MNISEFERLKPKETFRKINAAIKKYDKITNETSIMDDEDAIKIEMAYDFSKELKGIKKSFTKGD